MPGTTGRSWPSGIAPSGPSTPTPRRERAVVCGFPWEEVEDCRRENDYLLESAARYPQRLIPFVTFPFSPEGLRELERCLRGGARGAGELAPGTYGQEPLPSDFLREVFQAVREAGIVALVHLGHLGGGLLFYELMPEVAALCKDVRYDTAALPLLYDHRVWRVAQEVAGEKLLFGSDFPLLGPRRSWRGTPGGSWGVDAQGFPEGRCQGGPLPFLPSAFAPSVPRTGPRLDLPHQVPLLHPPGGRGRPMYPLSQGLCAGARRAGPLQGAGEPPRRALDLGLRQPLCPSHRPHREEALLSPRRWSPWPRAIAAPP